MQRHLGEGVQKLFGGAKKSADDISQAGEKKAGEVLDDASSKIKNKTEDVIPPAKNRKIS